MTQTLSTVKETGLLLLALVLAAALMVASPGSASAQEAEAPATVVVSLQSDVAGADFVVEFDTTAGVALGVSQPVEYATTAGLHQVTVASYEDVEIDAGCDATVSIDMSSLSVDGDEVSTSRSVIVDTPANETTTCTFEATSAS
jgi:hypothetical protein